MRRKMIQWRNIYRLHKRTICAAVSVALLAAWPMTANSEEYIETEMGEEAFASLPDEDGFLTDSISEDSDAVLGDSVIGEEPTDLFEDFSIEEEVQEEGFLAGDDTAGDDAAEDLLEASSVQEAVGETEALLQTEVGVDGARSGECGVVEGTVFWELDDDGTLHISGEGEMAGWDSPEEVPWAHCSELVTALDIQDGITGIGSHAFSGCSALTTARIG